MMNLQISESIPHPHWMKHLKIHLKPQIPYFPHDNEWLLGAVNNNSKWQPYGK